MKTKEIEKTIMHLVSNSTFNQVNEILKKIGKKEEEFLVLLSGKSKKQILQKLKHQLYRCRVNQTFDVIGIIPNAWSQSTLLLIKFKTTFHDKERLLSQMISMKFHVSLTNHSVYDVQLFKRNDTFRLILIGENGLALQTLCRLIPLTKEKQLLELANLLSQQFGCEVSKMELTIA